MKRFIQSLKIEDGLTWLHLTRLFRNRPNFGMSAPKTERGSMKTEEKKSFDEINKEIWRQINFADWRDSKEEREKKCLLWNYTFKWMANGKYNNKKTMRCNRIWLWMIIIIIILLIFILKPQADFFFSLSKFFLFSFLSLNKTSFHSFCRFLFSFILLECVYSVWQMSGHFQLFMTYSLY